MTITRTKALTIAVIMIALASIVVVLPASQQWLFVSRPLMKVTAQTAILLTSYTALIATIVYVACDIRNDRINSKAPEPDRLFNPKNMRSDLQIDYMEVKLKILQEQYYELVDILKRQIATSKSASLQHPKINDSSAALNHQLSAELDLQLNAVQHSLEDVNFYFGMIAYSSLTPPKRAHVLKEQYKSKSTQPLD